MNRILFSIVCIKNFVLQKKKKNLHQKFCFTKKKFGSTKNFSPKKKMNLKNLKKKKKIYIQIFFFVFWSQKCKKKKTPN